MIERISAIYKITSPSGKVYIGQTIDVNDRIRRYRTMNCRGQKHLYNSFLKYGWDSHKFEILQQLPFEQLNEAEINYIWRHNSTNREVGLNISFGGNNSRHSEESKILIRKNHPRCKEVFAEDKDGKVTRFQSRGEASRVLKVSRKSIRLSLKDPNIQIGKYKYRESQ